MSQVFAWSERIKSVMCAITTQPKVVHLLPYLFGVCRLPFGIRRVKLDDFVTETRNGLECLGQISAQLTAYRVELESNRMFFHFRFSRAGLRRRRADRDPRCHESRNHCRCF